MTLLNYCTECPLFLHTPTQLCWRAQKKIGFRVFLKNNELEICWQGILFKSYCNQIGEKLASFSKYLFCLHKFSVLSINLTAKNSFILIYPYMNNEQCYVPTFIGSYVLFNKVFGKYTNFPTFLKVRQYILFANLLWGKNPQTERSGSERSAATCKLENANFLPLLSFRM